MVGKERVRGWGHGLFVLWPGRMVLPQAGGCVGRGSAPRPHPGLGDCGGSKLRSEPEDRSAVSLLGPFLHPGGPKQGSSGRPRPSGEGLTLQRLRLGQEAGTKPQAILWAPTTTPSSVCSCCPVSPRG